MKREKNRASKSRCIMWTEQAPRARSLFQLVDVSAVRSTCTSAADAAVSGMIAHRMASIHVFLPIPTQGLHVKFSHADASIDWSSISRNLESTPFRVIFLTATVTYTLSIRRYLSLKWQCPNVPTKLANDSRWYRFCDAKSYNDMLPKTMQICR